MIDKFINKIICGNALSVLKQMPDNSVDSAISSPPYWQLRDFLYIYNMKRDKKGKFLKGYSYSPKTQFKKGQHWRKPKPHWNKDWFYQKYFIEKLSTTELARLCGCNYKNISYWMKKHSFEGRTISQARKLKYWGVKGEKNGMYGKTHTKEVKRKLRLRLKGKTYEEIYGKERAKKIKEKKTGENNPNWKGGENRIGLLKRKER